MISPDCPTLEQRERTSKCGVRWNIVWSVLAVSYLLADITKRIIRCCNFVLPVSAAIRRFRPSPLKHVYARSSALSVWRVRIPCFVEHARTVVASLLQGRGAPSTNWQRILPQTSAFTSLLDVQRQRSVSYLVQPCAQARRAKSSACRSFTLTTASERREWLQWVCSTPLWSYGVSAQEVRHFFTWTAPAAP